MKKIILKRKKHISSVATSLSNTIYIALRHQCCAQESCFSGQEVAWKFVKDPNPRATSNPRGQQPPQPRWKSKTPWEKNKSRPKLGLGPQGRPGRAPQSWGVRARVPKLQGPKWIIEELHTALSPDTAEGGPGNFTQLHRRRAGHFRARNWFIRTFSRGNTCNRSVSCIFQAKVIFHRLPTRCFELQHAHHFPCCLQSVIW